MENKKESLYRDLRKKDEQINNLKHMMGYASVIMVLVTHTLTVVNFNHNIDWMDISIKFIVFFVLASIIGAINVKKDNSDVVFTFFLISSFIVLPYILHIYFSISILITLLLGYFAGYYYKNLTEDQEEEEGLLSY
jgi:predicted membrane channel-forming protein YqfA (hemolysin III family)